MNELAYNTQQRRLPMPEYGRSVQNMIDHAITITNRAERQRCANTIINIMGGMFPHLRDVPDFKHKLWDHLAIMADFKLDIDYPFEIVKQSYLQEKPAPIPYPQNHIRLRHYGHYTQALLEKAMQYPQGKERDQLVRYIANFMKKQLVVYNKEASEDNRIFEDIAAFTNGVIQVPHQSLKLQEINVGQASGNSPSFRKKQKNKKNKQ